MRPLPRDSPVEALAADLRTRILDRELAPDTPLRELALVEEYGVARHTVRAALRALETEQLVRIEPNRGARVAALGPQEVKGLFELRTALETEGVRLALERNGGRLPPEVHAACARLTAACRPRRPWSGVVEAHDALHHAFVESSGSARLTAAHAALHGEMHLFVVGLPERWTRERMASNHEALVAAIEREGPDPLRAHLGEAAAALIADLPAT